LGQGLQDCGGGCRAGGEGQGVFCVFEGCHCSLEVVSVRIGTAGVFVSANRLANR
jgi:hypothetical protein